MPTANVSVIVAAVQGGATRRVDLNRARTVGEEPLDIVATVADDNGEETLWDAANSPVGDFEFAIIQVDPNGTYSDNDETAPIPSLIIELEGATTGVLMAFTVRREIPLIIPQSTVRPGRAGSDELIDKITARNENAAPSSGDGDVEVRITFY